MKKNIILCAFIVFSIWGCQQKITQAESNSAQYAKEFSSVKPKNFLVSVFVSYDTLSKWIGQRPDKTFFESKSDQSFIGFPIQSNLAGLVKFSFNNLNQVTIQAPVTFEAKPNVAGFSAGLVRGKLNLNMDVDLQLKSLNKFDVGNITYTYQWLEKPMVKVAGFGVNVGPVVDNLFKNKYNEVITTIKSNLVDFLHPTSLENILVKNSQNITWPSYVIPTSDVGLGIRKFDFSPKGLNLDVLVNTSVDFSKSQMDQKKLTRYYLNKDSKLGRELPFSSRLDWKFINEYVTKFAQEKLKNQRLKIRINGESSEYLRAHINGFKGPKSEMIIDFIPVVFNQHILGFRIIHQDLIGLSFPNSLLKNHVLKRIGRLATDFKFDLLKSSDLISDFSSSFDLNNANLRIDILQWNESSLYINGLLGADWKFMK